MMKGLCSLKNVRRVAPLLAFFQVLQDMVPPKKHLLRHQPANAQIGLMEGNTFCTTLQPRLFTMDLNVVEHKVFYTEVRTLCEAWALITSLRLKSGSLQNRLGSCLSPGEVG